MKSKTAKTKTTKPKKVQKFFRGDLVMISNLPPWQSHFSSGLAIVIGSEADQGGHGLSALKKYILYTLENENESAWYSEENLELVEIDRLDLLPENHRIIKSLRAKQERDENLKKSAKYRNSKKITKPILEQMLKEQRAKKERDRAAQDAFEATIPVHVVKNGERIKSLLNNEYNTYKLRKGETFDFSELIEAVFQPRRVKP